MAESELLIPVQGFKFYPTACLVDGQPTWAEWSAMLAEVEHVHRSAGWWLGDLLNYGEAAYGERYVQAVTSTGLALQTLMNYKAVCKALPPEARVAGLSFSAHKEIAFAPERAELLTWAREEVEAGRPPTSREIRERYQEQRGLERLITVRFTEAELEALYDLLDTAAVGDSAILSVVKDKIYMAKIYPRG